MLVNSCEISLTLYREPGGKHTTSCIRPRSFLQSMKFGLFSSKELPYLMEVVSHPFKLLKQSCYFLKLSSCGVCEPVQPHCCSLSPSDSPGLLSSTALGCQRQSGSEQLKGSDFCFKSLFCILPYVVSQLWFVSNSPTLCCTEGR